MLNLNPEEIAQRIRALEAAIYPPHIRFWQGMSYAEIVSFCCSGDENGILLWEHGYVLCARSEIADWAVLPDKQISPRRFFMCLRFMAEYYEGRTTTANCRVSTSYPLFLNLARKGYLEIFSERDNDMNGEAFKRLRLRFLPKAYNASTQKAVHAA